MYKLLWMTKEIILSFTKCFRINYSDINKTIQSDSIPRKLIYYLLKGDQNK